MTNMSDIGMANYLKYGNISTGDHKAVKSSDMWGIKRNISDLGMVDYTKSDYRLTGDSDAVKPPDALDVGQKMVRHKPSV